MVAVKLGPLAPLRRRNTIPTVNSGDTNFPIRPQSSSFSVNDKGSRTTELANWSLISITPVSYTSLKDLLQPTPVVTESSVAGDRYACGCATNCDGREIPIRNRLVKQAAWAYLQPMAISPSNSGRHLFWRLWARFSARDSGVRATSCLEFLREWIVVRVAPALRRLLGILGLETGR